MEYMSLAKEATDIIWEYLQKTENMSEEEKGRFWREKREEVIELFLEEEWDLSDRVISREVQEALSWHLPKDSQEELEEYFEDMIEDLRTEKEFTAYIYFPQIVDLPLGTEIGKLEIIEKPEEQEEIIEHWERLEEKGELYEGRSWGKFKFTSYKSNAYIREELIKHLKKPLSILNVILGHVSPPENLVGGIKAQNSSKIWYMEPERKPSGWTIYREESHEDLLDRLSEMANKDRDSLTPLERNILGSIELLILHSHEYRNEHSFLTLIAALEGLLLHEKERPKSSRMAEKAVKILHEEDSDIEEKIEDYERLKDWYNKRSEIIHGGHEEVARNEIRALRDAVERVTRRLVTLADEYNSIQKKRNENNSHKGLNDSLLETRLENVFD